MELFSKLYGCYYQIVGHILNQAASRSVTATDMIQIANSQGFEESALTIVPKLVEGEWELLERAEKGKFSSKIGVVPKVPLTDLQKSWLKTLLQDRRFCLFFTEEELRELEIGLIGVDDLYYLDDFHYFDQYIDGDDYSNLQYRTFFQMVLKAATNREVLGIEYESGKGSSTNMEIIPYRLEYSLKDDKFRIQCVRIAETKSYQGVMLNMARIKTCRAADKLAPADLDMDQLLEQQRALEPVVMEISGERNSLERCMLHFANYKKKTEFDEERGVYLCSIYYDRQDETELLIEILSFGPVVRVIGPDSFIGQIRERVGRQHRLLL